ncbi:Frigida-like protein [Hirschfeldia incana]|nr:Frigida-like protein [Hirschfeldia incana]
MEEMKAENELNLFGVKKDNLAKQLDKIHSHSSDILVFSVLWRDLSDYLSSAQEKVERRFRELKLKEAELEGQSSALEERGKVVEAGEAVAVELEVKSDGIRVEIEAKRKELDFVRNQVEVSREEFSAEEARLSRVKELVEECMAEKMSKESELNVMLEALKKTQAELGSNGEKLAQMETDLERYRADVSAEMEHLGRTQTLRRELDEEVEREDKNLTLVQDKLVECEKLLQTRSEDMMKTQCELDLKQGQLGQMEADLERHRVEVSAEKKHLETSQTHNRELEEEIERKQKDLTAVLAQISECGKQLESLQEKLDSQQKLLDTRSSELVSKEKELELLSLDLDLREQSVISFNNDMDKTCQQMESKAKKLEDIQKLIEERSAYLESVSSLIEEHDEELSSKEKRQDELTEAIRKLSLEITSKEKTLERAEDFIQQLSEEQQSAEKKLDSTRKHLEICVAEHESVKKDLISVTDTYRELLQDLDIKEKALKSLQVRITKRNKQVEEGEKKMQRLNDSSEELTRQLKLKQEEVCSVNKAIKECSGELEEKRKHRDQVQSSITDLTTQLKSKECDLSSIKKKIKGSLKDLQSKEEEQVRLKASLVEREKGLKLKEEEQVRLKASLVEREKGLEVKEKELDAREESIDKKDQQLKSTEQKLAKSFKEIELRAKQLSSFCQKGTSDQHVDLVRDANVSDEKTLQLLLRGHLKKYPQLHLDVLHSLKASSDPTKLVLETIRGLYDAQQRMTETNLDPDSFRSGICLLECLVDMSSKPNTEVQGEAVTFAMECKNTTLIKAENPVEVLGFLHFLAAFSVAYTFDASQVKNLLDDAFLRKYAPSLCKALGITASAPGNNVILLEDTPKQQPPEAPISNSGDSRSLNVQENIASSPLASEDALRDIVGTPSFSPNEVSTDLPILKDPGRFVLASVEEALTGARQREELSLADPIVKTLVPLLEELTRVVHSNDPELQADATKVAHLWSSMMGASGLKSKLEAWAFLQFIVAFGLAKQTNQNETLRFASHVAHFKHAPKLFRSLGLSSAIPNFVNELLIKAQYIPAIRFMLFFNVKSKFSPLAFLKQEIMKLRHSVNEKRRLDSQAEANRDAAKMREIIEIVEEFKLEIDIPVDLILKFMVPRDILTHNQHVVASSSPPVQSAQMLPRVPLEIQTQNQHIVGSSSVPIQSTQILPRVHVQAAHTVIHNSYIATHSSFPFLPTSLGATPNPQVIDVEAHQAGGSTAFQGQSSYHAGSKRPRVDPGGPRHVIRPCFNPPSGYGRF